MKRGISMKVFISWSGARSKKMAMIFRDWLPTVIQSLEPFVSSEDIEKGSRWNTEIAQELKDSSFGIICVTKDNLNSAWLNFEAGALSKTIDNNYVAPLLFDVKPSDLKDSPISQFQATSFTEEDMRRLVETLNVATGNYLTSTRLDKAFKLCYPDLDKSISNLKNENIEDENEGDEKSAHLETNILEELLEMTRNTQRLLGNTDTKLYGNIDTVQKKVDDILEKLEKQYDIDRRRSQKRISPIIAEQLFYSSYKQEGLFPYNILILVSLYKEECPWLYEAAEELVRVLNSKASKQIKVNELSKFNDLIEYTSEMPIIREQYSFRKDFMFLLRDLPHFISSEIERQSN